MDNNKILIGVLAIFIVGMTLGVVFSEPVDAKKYKNKKSITIKVKDGKKTIKIKCKYKKSFKQYLGHKKKYNKQYDAYIAYEKDNNSQNGKKGWWTGTMNSKEKWDCRHGKNKPVTKLKLHNI